MPLNVVSFVRKDCVETILFCVVVWLVDNLRVVWKLCKVAMHHLLPCMPSPSGREGSYHESWQEEVGREGGEESGSYLQKHLHISSSSSSSSSTWLHSWLVGSYFRSGLACGKGCMCLGWEGGCVLFSHNLHNTMALGGGYRWAPRYSNELSITRY